MTYQLSPYPNILILPVYCVTTHSLMKNILINQSINIKTTKRKHQKLIVISKDPNYLPFLYYYASSSNWPLFYSLFGSIN